MDKLFKLLEKIFTNKKVFWAIFIVGILALSVYQYLGLIVHHYPVPPGHDAMMHWNMAQPFYQGNVNLLDYLKSGAYPPGFLIFIAKMAHLFNTDMMNIMTWFTPSIIILAAVSMFFLVYYLFNPSAALICFYLYSFTAKIQVQQLNDGGYPNLIAAQILLPLFMLMLFLFIKNKKLINKIILGLITLALLISLPITHHLTTLYLLAVLATLPIVIIIYKTTTKAWSAKKGLLYLLAMSVILLVGFYIFLTSDFLTSTRELMGGSIKALKSWPFFKINNNQDPEAIILLKGYASYIGGVFVFYFGCLGVLTLGFEKKMKNKVWLFPILIWAVLLFLASRLSFLSNPDRLVRDLVYPLSITAGLFMYFATSFLIRKNKVLGYIFIITMLVFLGRYLIRDIKTATTYNNMVRITAADMKAIDYLKEQKVGSIYVEAYTFYFERFLPDWSTTYLWGPQTYQSPSIHPLDPSNAKELTALKNYDYVYIVDSQIGWTPTAVTFGFATNYLNNPNFELEIHAKSETNEVYLFRINK